MAIYCDEKESEKFTNGQRFKFCGSYETTIFQESKVKTNGLSFFFFFVSVETCVSLANKVKNGP